MFKIRECGKVTTRHPYFYLAHRRRFKFWLIVGLVAVSSYSTGWLAAWIYAGIASPSGIGPGVWRTTKGTGDISGGMLQRAIIARQGLWALPQSEAVYFTATTDDLGDPITNRCIYEIVGDRDPPTRWWSITLYRNLFWIDNPLGRYSWTSSGIERELDGRYRILIAASEQSMNWLPMGAVDGNYSIVFRNYMPEPQIAVNPVAVPLPFIRRLSCK